MMQRVLLVVRSLKLAACNRSERHPCGFLAEGEHLPLPALAALLGACTALPSCFLSVAVLSLVRGLINPLVNGFDGHVQLFRDVQFKFAASRLFATWHDCHVANTHQGPDVCPHVILPCRVFWQAVFCGAEHDISMQAQYFGGAVKLWPVVVWQARHGAAEVEVWFFHSGFLIFASSRVKSMLARRAAPFSRGQLLHLVFSCSFIASCAFAIKRRASSIADLSFCWFISFSN